MSDAENIVFGIDLGTTYSCIAYVDEYNQPVVVPNSEYKLTTPSVVLFEDEDTRIVGEEAKNSSVAFPDKVVSMVKRNMGEADWRFSYNGKEFTPEEISSYILRKLAVDAEQQLNLPVKDVVITCPAYFGIAQREATAHAGQIAGFNVREIINEPTAAAIMYGLQNEQDQVVLVYDLGGGTFDITVIEIKGGAITVIATGGDHHLGGRNWDEAVVVYLAEEWKNQTGSSDEPTDSPDTLQDLWNRAEQAKWSLSSRNETHIVVTHAGQHAKVALTRDMFNELTAGLLDRTIMYARLTMDEARTRGYNHFDQLLLVGGSTKMPQVPDRLEKEFGISQKVFEPDAAVAKGAAIYGHKLMLDEKIQIKIAEKLGTSPEEVNVEHVDSTVVRRAQEEVARDLRLKPSDVKKLNETKVTIVSSHSFGIIVAMDYGTPRSREIISNLVLAQDPLPASPVRTYGTLEDNQDSVELKIIENVSRSKEVEDLNEGQEIGNAILTIPSGLPAGTPIEVAFEMDHQGRLHVVGREPRSGAQVEASLETNRIMSVEELQEARARATKLAIS